MLFIASHQGIILAAATERGTAVNAACARYYAAHSIALEPAWLEVVCLHHVPAGRVWVRNIEQLLP